MPVIINDLEIVAEPPAPPAPAGGAEGAPSQPAAQAAPPPADLESVWRHCAARASRLYAG